MKLSNSTKGHGIGRLKTVAKVLALSAALYLATACGSGVTTKASEPESQPQAVECININDARAGEVTPENYLQNLEDCLPRIQEAKDTWNFGGFLYEPSDDELEEVFTGIFSDFAKDDEDLQYLVQSSIDGYRKEELDPNILGKVMPSIVGAFGKGLRTYVVIQPSLFDPDSPFIKNNADVESLVDHEIKHVEDVYEGINLGDNLHISFDVLGPYMIRKDFFGKLGELRAVYKELEQIFRERIVTGETSISNEWLVSQAKNYRNHWEFIESNASTELEIIVRDEQLERFKGIRSFEALDGNGFVLNFDLFGYERQLRVYDPNPD
jgi:hypothetical protein